MDIEQRLEARLERRFSRDFAAYERMGKREEIAEQMIGELNGGRFYVYPVGGKYREGTRLELIDFLIRNNYA